MRRPGVGKIAAKARANRLSGPPHHPRRSCPREPGKAVADFIEHERRSIAVLHAGRMNDDAQRQTLRINVNFSALHLLAGVIAGQAVMTAPCREPSWRENSG